MRIFVSISKKSKHFSFYFSFICNLKKKKKSLVYSVLFFPPSLLGTKHAWEKHFLSLISPCNLDARFLKFIFNIKTYKKFKGFISKLALRDILFKNNWYSIFYIFVKMNNIRDINYFTKKFTNYWYCDWLLINEKVILMMSLDENQ